MNLHLTSMKHRKRIHTMDDVLARSYTMPLVGVTHFTSPSWLLNPPLFRKTWIIVVHTKDYIPSLAYSSSLSFTKISILREYLGQEPSWTLRATSKRGEPRPPSWSNRDQPKNHCLYSPPTPSFFVNLLPVIITGATPHTPLSTLDLWLSLVASK